MASKDQYEFFKFLYEREERRYEHLEARARLYLAVITIFLAALLFKADEVRTSAGRFGITWNAVVIEASLLIAALLLVVLGAMIRTYEGVANGSTLIEGFEATPPSDQDFFDDRIVDFAAATERNGKVNDRAAYCLGISAIFLATAMSVLLVALAIGAYK